MPASTISQSEKKTGFFIGRWVAVLMSTQA
jgi:hypothetical protein